MFGGDVTKLSVRAVMAPFVAMEQEQGSLIKALQSRAKSTTDKPAIFTTLRSGLGTLIDRMIATIPPEWIRLSDEVSYISNDDEGWLIGTAKEVETLRRRHHHCANRRSPHPNRAHRQPHR